MNGYRIGKLTVMGLFLLGATTIPAMADTMATDDSERIAGEATATIGYRGVGSSGQPGRALEYDALEPSPTFKAGIFTDQGTYHLDLGVDYLSDDDFSTEAHFDTKGMIRLDLRKERFFHNLDHIPYDNGYTGAETGPPMTRVLTGTPVAGSRPDALYNGATRAFFTDQNPADRYGLSLDTSEVKIRIKCPDYPAHVNLSYWRYEKEGSKQLRFVGENCTTACHMQSKTRNIDRVTEEFKAGADAHVGFIDLAIDYLYRAFRDHEPAQNDYFGFHGSGRSAGYYDHSEDPDSRLTELTLRANTAPSGGLVGSASFTMGKRENRSGITSITPVDAETDYTKTAADVTYTPSQNWTFNFRYRLLDMDRDNPDTLIDADPVNNPFKSPLDVRESMDINRAWYEAIASYRPSPKLTVKGEFRREDIKRSDTGPGADHHSYPYTANPVDINPQWQLPAEETLTRVKLGFISRMLEKSALKVSGWAILKRSDNPAYGTSYDEGRELFLSASYNPAPTWGVLASANLVDEENDRHELDGYMLDRKRNQQSVNLGGWTVPAEGLSFDLNYGFLRTAIEQDLLFGASAGFTIEDDAVDYRQTVHTITLGATWQPVEKLSCRAEGYHIRSKAYFDPNFPTASFAYISGVGTASSSDLRDISELDIRQNGVRGRVDWQIDKNWSCGIEATYDKYDDRKHNELDGSVQTCMVNLTRRW